MSQTTNKPKPIKVLGAYRTKSPTDNLVYANAVHAGVFSDPTDYPTPPVDEATFKSAIDTLSLDITAALDGGKKAIAARNQQEEVVIKMMKQIGQYVETACKDVMTTFLKSGFQAAATAKAPKPPLTQFIRSITSGKTAGSMHAVPVVVDGAKAYEFRFTPVVNGTSGTPITQLVTTTRPATMITGLTPGTTYSIQVRSFADATGFADWSDPVTRICT
jgi:hypothetical protein